MTALFLNQIFLSRQGGGNDHLPDLLRQAQAKVLASFESCRYQLYGNELLRAFVRSEFGFDVLKAYDSLQPFAFKADLGRYCLLHHYGGWYFDIGLKILENVPLPPPHIDLLYFRDLGSGLQPHRTSYPCMNALVYAKPKHPVMERAIELVLRHCRDHFYGLTPCCPTGPGVFGRAIAMEGMQSSHCVGDFMPLTPFHPQQNLSFVMPTGVVVAQHKSTWCAGSEPGDLERLGGEGVNNYMELWKARQVYSESPGPAPI